MNDTLTARLHNAEESLPKVPWRTSENPCKHMLLIQSTLRQNHIALSKNTISYHFLSNSNQICFQRIINLPPWRKSITLLSYYMNELTKNLKQR